MFVGPNQSPIKRSDFVAGLDLIPNCETGVKLFVSKAYLNVQTGVENWGYSSLCVFLFPLPLLQPCLPPVDTSWKAFASRQSSKHGVGSRNLSWMALVCFGEIPTEALVLWSRCISSIRQTAFATGHAARCSGRSEAKHWGAQQRWWSLVCKVKERRFFILFSEEICTCLLGFCWLGVFLVCWEFFCCYSCSCSSSRWQTWWKVNVRDVVFHDNVSQVQTWTYLA